MLMKGFLKMFNSISSRNRIIINFINRIRLKNKDFTLISSNCTGAFILHDLNLKFLTPTINLFFYPQDFIKFVKNLDYYLDQEIKFISSSNFDYPIGKLDDIEIHFMHYKDNISAKDKWESRRKRINKNNIFIMMTDRDGCTEDIIRSFETLQYKNKVLFTNKPYKEYPSTFYVRGFEQLSSVGHLYEFENIFGKKYYDNFNYIKWFNSKL